MTSDLTDSAGGCEVPRSGVPEHLAKDMTIAEQGEWLQGFFKRNRVSRRAAVAGGVGTFGVLAMSNMPYARAATRAIRSASPAATAAGATVAGRHIGFGQDPSTKMWVSGEFFDTTGGRTNPGNTVSVVFGLDTSYGQTQQAEVRSLTSTVPTSPSGSFYALTQYFVHALLTGLTPGTTYHWAFQVGNTIGPDAAFTTAPAPGATPAPFTFTSIADQGINYSAVPDPYKSVSGPGNASSDYYNATNANTNNPPRDPADDGSDGNSPRATTGRRQDGQPNRTTNPAASVTGIIAGITNASGKAPAFNLIGGDIAYADPAGNGLANYFAGTASSQAASPSPASGTTAGYVDAFDPTIWSAYFVQNEGMGKQTAQMFAFGNHDQEAVYDGNAKSTSPQNGYLKGTSGHGYLGHLARINPLGGGAEQFGSPSPTVYGFRHGNVGVVAIDCNDLSTEIQSNTGYTNGGQVAWLDAQLNRFRQDKTIDFVVAFFHHCAYATSSNHHSDNGVRSAVGPLFTKYQVDVVFQGHNHQFERTDPLKYDAATGTTTVGIVAPDASTVGPTSVKSGTPQWQGTTYINNGNAGRPRYGIDPDKLVSDPVTGAYTERFRANPNTQGSENIAGQLQTAQTATGGKVLTAENVTWSQARYDDYGVSVVDVVPAAPGGISRMMVRHLDDFGVEVDRVTLLRIAGAAPAAALPEAPMALLLPASGLAIAGGYLAYRKISGRGEESAVSV